jgi:hypothetical protein
MKTNFTYIPILKWKQGEQGALKELEDSIKDKIVPLIEITPDFNFSKLKDSLNNWKNRYFYFDILPEVYEENSGEIYFDLLSQCDPKYVIPVVFLSDNKDAIKEANNYSKNGIAIRITSDDLDDLDSSLMELKDEFGYNNIDLIIDLREINENNFGEKKIVAKALLPDIPEIQSFRNIILSSSAFPKTLSSFGKYEIHHISRYDYQLWSSLLYLEKRYNIKLKYSDYCINHPSFFEYIPGMSPAFNIRYSTNDSFIVIRGDSTKKGGLDVENVVSLCQKLINLKDFSGQDFSWGDNYIFTRCSKGIEKCGNLSTWRKVGTNHHITFVVNQLSSLL